MATYVTPEESHTTNYVERDTGSGSGVWAIVAALIILFAILFFGFNLFGSRNNGSADINVQGEIPTTGGGSGSGTGAQ